jgi:hypothetical protein
MKPNKVSFLQNLVVVGTNNYSNCYLSTCGNSLCPNKRFACSRRISGKHKCRNFFDTCSMQDGRNSNKLASSVPDSLTCLSENSYSALTAALEAGYRRLLIDVDLQQGDPTYTNLNSAVPFLRELVKVIEERENLTNITLLFPDEGSAAFARKDWNFSDCSFSSFSSYSGKDSNRGWLIMICPSAVDVEAMEKIVDKESPFLNKDARPVILVNPNLVDMGATGLGFNARQLRQRLLSTFESIYFLRVYSAGVMVRQYPFEWSIWLEITNEDENTSSDSPYRYIYETFPISYSFTMLGC